MGDSSGVKITDHIPQIIATLHLALGAGCEQVAQGLAADYAASAPKASGFMASSAYVVTKAGSTYGANVVGSGPMLPSVEPPADALGAIMAVAAAYAGYVEYGTVHMAAQPAFHPALERAAKALEAVLESLESTLARDGIHDEG